MIRKKKSLCSPCIFFVFVLSPLRKACCRSRWNHPGMTIVECGLGIWHKHCLSTRLGLGSNQCFCCSIERLSWVLLPERVRGASRDFSALGLRKTKKRFYLRIWGFARHSYNKFVLLMSHGLGLRQWRFDWICGSLNCDLFVVVAYIHVFLYRSWFLLIIQCVWNCLAFEFYQCLPLRSCKSPRRNNEINTQINRLRRASRAHWSDREGEGVDRFCYAIYWVLCKVVT